MTFGIYPNLDKNSQILLNISNMTTVTISLPDQIAKNVDSETKRRGFATRSEFIRSLLRRYFSSGEIEFRSFVRKPLEEVETDLLKTGKYNQKFIKSIIRGLEDSSFYEDKTS